MNPAKTPNYGFALFCLFIVGMSSCSKLRGIEEKLSEISEKMPTTQCANKTQEKAN